MESTSTYWFIDEGYFAKYLAATNLGHKPEVSAERVEQIRGNADRWARSGYASDNLRVVNGEARIRVAGVLLESANVIDEFFAKYLGEQYATYAGIEAQIEAAESNRFVESIVFEFDTPGGIMAGVDNCAMAIATSTKPTEARVGFMAASAGYYLASQCDKITATNPTSSVGSIGVVVDLMDATEAYRRFGLKRYSLTSSAAPKKRPEPHSEEFKQQIVARLDELHAVFALRVAEGRSRATGKKISPDYVNANFGEGGMVIASEALEKGMIDGVLNVSSKTKEVGMTEQERADMQVQIEAARAEGIENERARVAALLPWMDADSDRVMTAISEGETLSPKLMSELSASAREKAKADALAQAEEDERARVAAAAEARASEEPPVITGVETEDEKTESEQLTDKLYSNIKKRQGGK